MTATVSDIEIADVLDRAAARIEPLPGTTQWRWCRGKPRRGQKVCAEAALAVAVHGDPLEWRCGDPADQTAMRLESRIGIDRVAYWSDHVAKSGREVAETFRRVARELREAS